MALHKFLATLFVDSTGSGNYVAIGKIKKFDPPKMKRGSSKTTDLSSANMAHTFLASWIDAGEVSGMFYFLAADFNTMLGYFTALPTAATRNWRIRYNDGTTSTSGSQLNFTGHVTDLGDDPLEEGNDDPIVSECKIKISGLPTFAVAT